MTEQMTLKFPVPPPRGYSRRVYQRRDWDDGPVIDTREYTNPGYQDWLNLMGIACEAIEEPGLILETGTGPGHLTRALLNVAAVKKSRVVTVDIDSLKWHEINLQDNPNLEVVTGDSVEWINAHEGDFAFVLLDSDHRKDHVLAELRALKGRVKRVAIHDLNMTPHAVHIREALKEFNHDWLELRGEYGLALVDMTTEVVTEGGYIDG